LGAVAIKPFVRRHGTGRNHRLLSALAGPPAGEESVLAVAGSDSADTVRLAPDASPHGGRQNLCGLWRHVHYGRPALVEIRRRRCPDALGYGGRSHRPCRHGGDRAAAFGVLTPRAAATNPRACLTHAACALYLSHPAGIRSV